MTKKADVMRCMICGSANLREHREGMECQQCGAVTPMRGHVTINVSRRTLMGILEAMDYHSILFHQKEIEEKSEELKSLLKRTDYLSEWKTTRHDDEVY